MASIFWDSAAHRDVGMTGCFQWVRTLETAVSYGEDITNDSSFLPIRRLRAIGTLTGSPSCRGSPSIASRECWFWIYPQDRQRLQQCPPPPGLRQNDAKAWLHHANTALSIFTAVGRSSLFLLLPHAPARSKRVALWSYLRSSNS